jgi:hypothetical protein
VGAATCIETARRKRTNLQHRHAATASWLNYRGCRLAKKDMGKNKPQRTPKTTTGRVFTAKFINPTVSFVAALRGHTIKQSTILLRELRQTLKILHTNEV